MAMYSFEEESQFLATLINHPDSFIEISSYISEEDFYSENSQVNKTIFSILKRSIESGNQIDYVMLTERALSLNLSFQDDINIGDYIQALSLRKTNPKNIIGLARDLKKYSTRRTVFNCGAKISKRMQNASSEDSFSQLIEDADKIYNDTISLYDNGSNVPEDLFGDMEDYVEDRGNNPIEEFGLTGPHNRLHELYGSLLRPGNITTITARSGVGKTQFCLDFCLKTSELNNYTPILHFDNGEMSKEELRMRLCASLSGVPLHLIETGKWRKSGSNIIEKVRSVWPKIKKYNLHYFNVAGMNVDQMVNLVKRFYYSKVGRGNQMIFNFDYIKTTSENLSNKSEWQVVGEMVDKFKKLVQRDILFDGQPMIAMMTSVQSNRSGITNNRRAENIVEDESIVSLSDRIIQFSSHLFSLRQKSQEEMTDSPNFGTHKLSCFKHRHLGSNYMRALQPVRLSDDITLVKNSIYLNFDNFNITEVGDTVDLVATQMAEGNIAINNNPDQLPDI
jgi:replicative DNA helicase